jgi:hypothetical protein
VLPPLPFVVVYRIGENTIEIMRVIHGAQTLAIAAKALFFAAPAARVSHIM